MTHEIWMARREFMAKVCKIRPPMVKWVWKFAIRPNSELVLCGPEAERKETGIQLGASHS